MNAVTNKSKNETDTSDVSAQLEVLRDDVATLTQIIGELAKSKSDEALSIAKAKASDFRDSASDHAEAARRQALEVQDKATDFVRTQPATALGIAAGVGFLIGFLGSRK